ncbi:hypothetical protein DAPPUDRAFT_256603 [Daphnia pulex]|uniref:Uncharacterized protein n=1 Tax=Daphnia pulex TaxID=6669 RepID=E9HBR3_DAPPU|nr:hypothetical protein DAPPUDRAFT_256603 [Daphnia pulex]|eukprot:EFX70827.1 hypothetical protein DAPPUDRAFT_256603 [Daphnia pulex]
MRLLGPQKHDGNEQELHSEFGNTKSEIITAPSINYDKGGGAKEIHTVGPSSTHDFSSIAAQLSSSSRLLFFLPPPPLPPVVHPLYPATPTQRSNKLLKYPLSLFSSSFPDAAVAIYMLGRRRASSLHIQRNPDPSTTTTINDDSTYSSRLADNNVSFYLTDGDEILWRDLFIVLNLVQ